MNLHSGSGTSPVSSLPGDFRLTWTWWRSLGPAEEPPLHRPLFRSPRLPDTPERLRGLQHPRAPEGSALRGGEGSPARGPKSSTCRAQDKAGAVPSPPHQDPRLGAPLSCGRPLQLCGGRISCCSGWSSPDSCRCRTRTTRLEPCSSCWSAGRCIWCAAPERQARGSCLTACCAKGKAPAPSWKQTSGTGLGWENIHGG